MAPPRFLQRWISLSVKRVRIDEVLLLVICLAAVYFVVMSFLLMSERTYAVRPWQTSAVVSRDIDGQVKRAEEKNDGMATDKVKESVNSIKTILLWNPYFDNDTYHFGLGRQPFEKNQCKVNTCSTTTDRQAALHADAVIFHSPEIDRRPTYRPPSQLYVFVQREPQYPKSRHVLNSYHDMFNLTMTYRHDSDIPIPYGQVVRIQNYRADNHHVYPDPRTKPRQVAWVVSHCHTLSRRELYVAELQRYIDVDVYGDCGKPTCNKTLNCFPDLEKKYKSILPGLREHFLSGLRQREALSDSAVQHDPHRLREDQLHGPNTGTLRHRHPGFPQSQNVGSVSNLPRAKPRQVLSVLRLEENIRSGRVEEGHIWPGFLSTL